MSTTGRPPVLVIFAITISGITGNTLIAPAVVEILDGLDASQALAGLVIAAGTVPGIVLAPVIGLVADRFGRREILVPCLVLFGLAGGAAALATDLPTLLGLRLLQGAGSAGLVNLAIVLIGDHWDGTERSRIIGRNSAVLTVGLAVLPTIGGALTELGGWQAPFLLYPLSLVTAVVCWRWLPAGGARPEQSVRAQLTALRPHLARREVKALFAATAAVFALIFGALLTLLPLVAESRFGLGPTVRGILLGLPALGSTAMALNLGRLTAWIGRRALFGLGAGAFAVGLAVVGVAPVLPVLVVAVVVIGIGEGSTVPNLQDLGASAAPTAQRGVVVATQVASARVGQTFGPAVASPLYAATGDAVTYLVAAGWALLVLGPLARRAAGAAPSTARARWR